MPGPTEWLIVGAVVLLLFGAKKLPDLARSLGRSSSEFKKGMREGGVDEDEEDTTTPSKAPPETTDKSTDCRLASPFPESPSGVRRPLGAARDPPEHPVHEAARLVRGE